MRTFRIGGVHPQDNKQFSAHQPITECPLPKQAIIPLVQHIGAPAQAVVEVGAKVKVGELLAKRAAEKGIEEWYYWKSFRPVCNRQDRKGY